MVNFDEIEVPTMCQTCKLLYMHLAGWAIGFKNPPKKTHYIDVKGDAHFNYIQEYRWLSPKEIKQGFIDKEEI